ncbi:cytochrome P450 [Scleromatobacter humisilvae]|uniref:Cytochrome P450 n=1 Tax=Scleromatobacter humisilvae TaxID=2897159 RepID=A0A9X2BYT0_9BURK|nr:cytochrome P450 [Scleromatobacter humisilvae]MCK9685652.1 cytochrome P450 [Scleromatobacter humisilvae]
MQDRSEALPESESRTTGVPGHVPPELVREFDFRTGLGDRPHEVVGALHGGPRIVYSTTNHHHVAGVGSWIPTRAEDIRAVLQDAEAFSSRVVRSSSALTLIPLELDPPEHGAFRAIMNPLFSPNRIKVLEAKIRDRARALVENCAAKGESEYIDDFARPLPIGIFVDLMGLPPEDLERFLAWEKLIIHDMGARARTMKEVGDYLSGLIADRRVHPTDDLITFAVKSEIDGKPLSDAQVLGICVLLFMAGLDTVTSALGFQLRYLAEHPNEQQRLRDDPSLIPAAVEELLRAYAVVNTTRYATRDVELAGVTIKKGDNVTCSTILASRDPREFERSDEVLLDRSPNLHNAFSYGPHRCIGSHLARRELVIGLEEWLKRIPPFRLKDGQALEAHGGGVFGLEALPLVW